jgi:hypothetical protein
MIAEGEDDRPTDTITTKVVPAAPGFELIIPIRMGASVEDLFEQPIVAWEITVWRAEPGADASCWADPIGVAWVEALGKQDFAIRDPKGRVYCPGNWSLNEADATRDGIIAEFARRT